MEKNKITNVDYQLRLWQVRSKLQSKGIVQPINEMLKRGLIKKDPRNNALILGRIRDEKFLDKLENFNNQIE